jgi:FMN reductase
MNPVRIVVISAGLGQPSATRRLGDRLASAASDRLRAAGRPVEVEVVELREFARDLADHLVTGFPSPRLAGVIERVLAADALLAVSPIFSASYSGLFKTFVDVLQPQSLVGKPVLIAATAGTARHSLALEHAMRPLFAYLRTVVLPTAVFAATEDWASPGALAERIERAAGELAALLGAGQDTGPGQSKDEESDEVPAFAALLRRAGVAATG